MSAFTIFNSMGDVRMRYDLKRNSKTPCLAWSTALIVLFIALGFAPTSADVIFNPSGSFTFGDNARIEFAGDWLNNGATIESNDATWVSRGGSSTFSGVGDEQFGGFVLAKSASAELHLASDLFITNHVTCDMGLLLTGDHQLTLGATAAIINEHADSHIQGQVFTSRVVSEDQADDFGNIGFSLSAGSDSLGSVHVTRVSGPGAAQTIENVTGIARHWLVVSEFPPAQGRDVTLQWLSPEDNGIDLTQAQVWRGENCEWLQVGPAHNASGTRQVTVNTVNFSAWTVTDFSYDVDGDINGDGQLSQLDLALVINYILQLGSLDSYQQVLANINGDSQIDIQDVLLLVNALLP